jgi:23S rRNA pseudouridine2605 synthase
VSLPERRIGLARRLSKAGFCSRAQAAALVASGSVRVNGRIVRDPEAPTLASSRIQVQGREVAAAPHVYIALNKPRGLVTTTTDERGRDTVYRCFEGSGLPWIAPVGRLDKASEGLLLFTNDSEWAAAVTDPSHGLRKVYHVQIDRPDVAGLSQRLEAGIDVQGAGRLRVERAAVLRVGARRSWLELTLAEGRNRQIRRLFDGLDIRVERLIRVRIGAFDLGDLAKGSWRHVDPRAISTVRRSRNR